MKVKWDFSELEKFADNLADIAEFNRYCEEAAKEIAEILKNLLVRNTPRITGFLRSKWKTDNVAYDIKRDGNKFLITLINTAEYATWVNDGHRQHVGQFVPGYWSGNRFIYDVDADGGMVLRQPAVKGRFFVEASINQLHSSVHMEKIIYDKLQKWWKGCLNV